MHPAHLVAVHHEVMCGDERFENHDPAVAGRALQQRVCQVGDADVQLIGAVDQVWGTEKKQTKNKTSHDQDRKLQQEGIRGRHAPRYQPNISMSKKGPVFSQLCMR